MSCFDRFSNPAKQVEEDTLSLIPEDEACAIEEEITRRIHQEDSSYTDLLKKVKSSAGEAAAELETGISIYIYKCVSVSVSIIY